MFVLFVSEIVNRWVKGLDKEMRDLHNTVNTRAVDKDTIPGAEQLFVSKDMCLLNRKDNCIMVTAEWSRNVNIDLFGLYSIGVIENNNYSPYWIEKWTISSSDESIFAKINGLITVDTTGRVGIIVERTFYEGGDIQLRLLSNDLKMIESEISIIPF